MNSSNKIASKTIKQTLLDTPGPTPSLGAFLRLGSSQVLLVLLRTALDLGDQHLQRARVGRGAVQALDLADLQALCHGDSGQAVGRRAFDLLRELLVVCSDADAFFLDGEDGFLRVFEGFG